MTFIASCRGSIPPEQLDDMRELTEAGEGGVALENLSTQLYEYEVRLDGEALATLRALCDELTLDPKYWTRLTT